MMNQAKMTARKWKKTANEFVPWESIEILLNSLRRKRSSLCRLVRNSSWGQLGTISGVFDLKTNKRTKVRKDGNSVRGTGKNDLPRTRIRLKLKVRKDVCRSSLEVVVPEPVETASLAESGGCKPKTSRTTQAENQISFDGVDHNHEDVNWFPPRKQVDNNLDSSWPYIYDSVRDLHLTEKDMSEDYRLKKFSRQQAPNYEDTSSRSDVEPPDGETHNRCMDAGTSPDSEVINVVPNVGIDYREEGNLLCPIVTSPIASVAFGDVTSSTLSRNGDKRKKKIEKPSEGIEHNMGNVFPVAGSKDMFTLLKKSGSKEQQHYSGNFDSAASSTSRSETTCKECSEESLCFVDPGNIQDFKGPLILEHSIVDNTRYDSGKVVGHSKLKSKKMSRTSMHKIHKTSQTLKSSKKRECMSATSSDPSKGNGENACGWKGNQNEPSKQDEKKECVMSNQLLCVSSDFSKAGNYILDEHRLMNAGCKSHEKDIMNSGLVVDALGDQWSLQRRAWVRCDDCYKWRCIPATLADTIEETNCPWSCKDNFDKAFADCSIPQEKSNKEINEELQISDASGEEDAYHAPLNSKALEHRQPKVPRQSAWTLIKSNLFLHRNRKKQTIDEIMVCQCKPSRDRQMGCGEECLNRMLNIECVHGTCPCGHLCSNQQFQKRKYAKLKFIKCGKKGYGLQLQQDISQGMFIIEYVGEVLDLPAYEARQKEYASKGHRHFYFMTLNGSEVIDACVKGNLGRFINHSCEPNCQTEKWMVNGEICVGIFALRDIQKGEELTFDYNYVRVFGAAAKKCVCGSSNCRGYIGGDPLNTEIIVQDESDDDYPEPIMVCENDKVRSGRVGITSTTFDDTVLQSTPEGDNVTEKYSSMSLVNQNTMYEFSSCSEPEVHRILENDKFEVEGVGIIPENISKENEDLMDAVTPVLTQSQSSFDIKMPSQHVEVSSVDEATQSVIKTCADPQCMQKGSSPVWGSETCSLNIMSNKSETINEDMKCVSEGAEMTGKLSKLNSVKKTSGSSASVKKVKSTYNDTNIKMQLAVSNKSEVMCQKGRKLSEVEEKLNELLDERGGICRRKDAPRSYLKLLNFTAASNNRGNGEACQSSRDLSIILDAILKTKSRTVLVDIVNKNGLQMLHNIMKQCRSNFTNIPVLRKLLKVLEYLAMGEILTSQHISGGPPVLAKESFIESMLALTAHADKQIHRIARNFRDNWIPWNLRRFMYMDRAGGRAETPKNLSCSDTKQPISRHEEHAVSVLETRKRRTRWDQPTKIKYRVSATESLCPNEDPPPGFLVPLDHTKLIPNSYQVAHGHPKRRFNSRLPVSYGIPLSIMQQVGTPEDALGSWAVAPGIPFCAFPPLPPLPHVSADGYRNYESATKRAKLS